ncbi:pantetheine-phosphate adenylyltransferase [Periweissella fabalis]|uniref:Phosphopantetheine adenylyltransferase n=1 Tax=Periweissella fabalis TaxID=1070421 RepID=A0A7X6N3F2_9LACO|nr:pantetheine-phosphate adenylyltransferase [Periweissella fabalis]MCM0598792.1 pantetheine-phosphate adenylyltransferase [Periweissella fabalis]NKZ24609.1 pantetheine-phosphate adenylyltransferase [Periweissella fabalis]
MKIALYPGSFDPLTNGHLDIIQRASKLFDRLVIGVGTNTSKAPLFSTSEKIILIREVTAEFENVDVIEISGLTVDVMDSLDADYLVRGLRNENDYLYERDIAEMNRSLRSDIETVILMAHHENQNIASSMIKEIAHFGGDVSKLVPKAINDALELKHTQK